MRVSLARQFAYQVLSKIEHGGAFTNLVLQQALRGNRLDARDKALATEVIYGTLQRRRSLDVLLQPHSKRRLEALDAPVLTLLRMTAYQLSFLDKVPPYAAINDAVELCKGNHAHSAGYVNGVLRAFNRDGRPAQERLAEYASKAWSWADRMGILYSFPTWLVEELARDYGQSRTEDMLRSFNDRSYLSVRVNLNAAQPGEVLETLPEEVRSKAELSRISPAGLRFERGFDVESWDAFRTGLVTVQDEAAMLVAPLLEPDKHRVILDMCAAPGTKTTHLAEMQHDKGQVTAVDLHPHKLELLHHAALRLHLESIQTRAGDARELDLDPSQYERYDAVLLDAPCTGLGVLRHRPDIRWKRKPEDIRSLRTLQVELLRTAAKLVKPGGVIVYSTCTLTREENESVVQEVVADASSGLQWDDLRAQLPEPMQVLVSERQGGLLITPEMFGTDGFYMARLRKPR